MMSEVVRDRDGDTFYENVENLKSPMHRVRNDPAFRNELEQARRLMHEAGGAGVAE
jgi:hypothetical protein